MKQFIGVITNNGNYLNASSIGFDTQSEAQKWVEQQVVVYQGPSYGYRQVGGRVYECIMKAEPPAPPALSWSDCNECKKAN